MTYKKSRIFGLFALVSVLFLFTGCTALNRGGTDDEGKPVGGDVFVGTQGLEMEFLKDLPSQIFEGSPLSLIVELKNLGVHDIKGGRLYLSGFDEGIIPMRDTQKFFDIEGKSLYNLNGGFNTIDFTSQTVNLPIGTDSYRPKFVLSACYQYKTTASPVVCIDPAPQLGTQDKACTAGSASIGGGQGGPVIVSSLVSEALPGKTRFRIEVSNAGGGKVVNFRNCPYKLGYQDLNYVQYQVSMSSASGKDCKPVSPLKLVDGKATIYCTFDISGQTAYTTPLSITLTYDYMDSITKDIEIRSLG